jgi:hypothetical protein
VSSDEESEAETKEEDRRGEELVTEQKAPVAPVPKAGGTPPQQLRLRRRGIWLALAALAGVAKRVGSAGAPRTACSLPRPASPHAAFSGSDAPGNTPPPPPPLPGNQEPSPGAPAMWAHATRHSPLCTSCSLLIARPSPASRSTEHRTSGIEHQTKTKTKQMHHHRHRLHYPLDPIHRLTHRMRAPSRRRPE